jgi:phosphotriesterase-related protein
MLADMVRREFMALMAPLARGQVQAAGVRLPGSVLVHEHILVDFGGWQVARPDRYDEDEVVRVAKVRLEELKPFGCRRLQECTPNYLGRNPALLTRLQDETGIEIWTNTGIYGAADRKGVPDFARTETAAQLAARWEREWRDGIDGVKPRFIKTAVNGFPLDELDRKLVEAACLVSNRTGLVICSHTNGAGPAALAQLEILERMKTPLSKFVWVHAQNEPDGAFHEKVARAGAWVELDGINEKSAARHLGAVRALVSRGLLGRVLVSQDSGWYRVGEPGGGRFNGFTYIYTDFVPRLQAGEAEALLVKNPVACFG